MAGVARAVSAGGLAPGPAGGGSGGAAGSYPATARTCLSFGLRATPRQCRGTAEPRACAGLSPEQVNLAVARAIREAVGPEPKALARHLADQDSTYLAPILSTIRPAPPAPVTPATAAPTRPSASLPLGLAALAASLFTAAAGAYLFAGWRAGGGPRAPRRAAPAARYLVS